MLGPALLLMAVSMAPNDPAVPADGVDVQLPVEIASHVPSNLRGYFLVFLVNPPTPKDMPRELFLQHQAYIRKQVDAGVFKLVGPVSNHERIRGLKIVNAPTLERAREIAEGDPAVQAKVFGVEVYPATFPSLSGLKIEYPHGK